MDNEYLEVLIKRAEKTLQYTKKRVHKCWMQDDQEVYNTKLHILNWLKEQRDLE